MHRQYSGLPANIWTLLETLDDALKEPEWVPAEAAATTTEANGGATKDGGFESSARGDRKARRRQREEAILADVDQSLFD